MNKLVVACPTCGHEMNVPESAMGKRGKCTVCGIVFEVTQENSRVIAPTPPAPSEATTVVQRAGSPVPKPKPKLVSRIASMDQLRGYAIFGMILVDALGNFDIIPGFLHHHRDKYSYADTIAPLFVFVVGMGFRLSIVRRVEKEGVMGAYLGAFQRYATLFIVAIFFYGPNFTKNWWDALTDIALAGIITLPLIDKNAIVRGVAAFCYMGVYMFFFLGTGYGDWLFHESMNGGPLGCLMSAFALLMGTIAYDLLDNSDQNKTIQWSLGLGCGLIVLSFIVWKLIPADLEPYAAAHGEFWAFAARWKAAPVELLSVGLAWFTFLGFYMLCDVYEKEVPMLTILGENPLVIYLLQYSLFEMHGAYIEETKTNKDFFYAIASWAAVYGFCYAAARRLHNQGYIIKL